MRQIARAGRFRSFSTATAVLLTLVLVLAPVATAPAQAGPAEEDALPEAAVDAIARQRGIAPDDLTRRLALQDGQAQLAAERRSQ
jgi:CO/xanthine dehydrogenase Mo-binding subunit